MRNFKKALFLVPALLIMLMSYSNKSSACTANCTWSSCTTECAAGCSAICGCYWGLACCECSDPPAGSHSTTRTYHRHGIDDFAKFAETQSASLIAVSNTLQRFNDNDDDATFNSILATYKAQVEALSDSDKQILTTWLEAHPPTT